jgi:hypothetical protein
VRAKVQELLSKNSFPESCFCKGCVLPVVDSVSTDYLTARWGATRFEVHHALRCEGFDTPLYDCSDTQVGFSSATATIPAIKVVGGNRVVARRIFAFGTTS